MLEQPGGAQPHPGSPQPGPPALFPAVPGPLQLVFYCSGAVREGREV